MQTLKTAWIDLVNPSDVQFFKPLISSLPDYDYLITTRDRAEIKSLTSSYGLKFREIGTDSSTPFKKSFNAVYRIIQLLTSNLRFEFSLSFENAQSTLVSYLKHRNSILYCDNDLKFIQSNAIQDVETRVKSLSSYVVIPKACQELFGKHVGSDRLITYDGYKEDVYIADFVPDPKFLQKVPFKEFVVLRPEALGSFYVKENKSIVPDLLELFNREHMNVVYLPREKSDYAYAKNYKVFIPEKTLNGLDLCYYSRAVLTGSGTFAREAACMGRKAVSFFPSNKLLSVDRELVEAGKILHSRDPREILSYVLSGNGNRPDIERSKKAKSEVVRRTRGILKDMVR